MGRRIFPSALLLFLWLQPYCESRSPNLVFGQTVVGRLGAESAPLAAGRVTEPTDHIGVNSLAAESNSKSTQNWRSQLLGRGFDIAESIFLPARLAESIFRDVIVMNLSF